MKDHFRFMVLETIAEIPIGKVASYSQIAKQVGFPKRARHVGNVVKYAEMFGNYPCHRVLHADGTLVAHWDEQKMLLAKEGVVVMKNGKVDMKKYQW